MNHFPVLVGFYATCSTLHVTFIIELVFKSAHQRTLFFHKPRPAVDLRTKVIPRSRLTKIASSQIKASIQPTPPDPALSLSRTSTLTLGRHRTAQESLLQIQTVAPKAWGRSFSVAEWFDVGGKYFPVLFLIREAIEATLQSIQACSLSKYVPRIWLNQSIVVIVPLSCWSMLAIHFFLRRSPRLQLILVLLADIVLDMASSTSVPVVLEFMYLPFYDSTLQDFETIKYYDNVWVANLNSEFRQLFIQSWFDFGIRALFEMSMLLALDDMKLLATEALDDVVLWYHSAAGGHRSSLRNIQDALRDVVVKVSPRLEKFVYMVLVVWGFVVLGLHTGSAHDGELHACMARVRSWLAIQATCAALEINYHNGQDNGGSGIVGTPPELEAHWANLAAHEVTLLIVHNCPELHMPASIQSFLELIGLYIFNGILASWSASALQKVPPKAAADRTDLCRHDCSLRRPLHQQPTLGFRCSRFPLTLTTLLLGGTPLDKLPSDLYEIWPRSMRFLLMENGLATIPEVLLRMGPAYVDLQFNLIEHLPAALFELPSLHWLDMGWSPIQELPKLVRSSTALLELNFEATNLSRLPK